MNTSEINNLYKLTKEVEKRTNFYSTYPLNHFWSDSNFHFMANIIDSQDSIEGKLHQVIGSQLYSHGQNNPAISQKQFDWWRDYFNRCHGLSIEDFKLRESQYWIPEKVVTYNNQNFSIDLFRSYVYYLEIKKHCSFDQSKRTRLLELGSGCGSLGRVLSSEIPNTTYIFVDIPESLYFSYSFIRLNFPDKKCLWVSDPSFDMNTCDKYDYVFVPVVFNSVLTGLSIDMFINTCSLGEMTNTVVRFWFDMIQNKMKTKYVFSVNRFLNTIVPGKRFDWRLNENECCAHFDPNWKMLKWRLEPEFASCPFYEGFAARCLEIIAERDTSQTPEQHKAKAYQYINDSKLEDWHRLHGQGEFTMTLNDNRMYVDLENTGSLFRLWDSMRLYKNVENISLFLQYLDQILLRVGNKQFEEYFYYKNLLKRTSGGFLFKSSQLFLPRKIKEKSVE